MRWNPATYHKFVFVQLWYAASSSDLLIHQRLRERGLVKFIMAPIRCNDLAGVMLKRGLEHTNVDKRADQ